MTMIDTAGSQTRRLSGEANGKIWGARATDWALIQEPQCAAGYHAVFDKLPVGSKTRLLDVGCGAGMAMQLAADLGAEVAGIDASAGLLEVARDRLPGARLERGDLEILPFDDDSFDVVTGFNAFQFAADPVAALREARRVTKPGGKVFIMTWGEPGSMEVTAMVAALKPLLPPMPANASGPFALSEPGKLEELASSAGLTPRTCSTWTAPGPIRTFLQRSKVWGRRVSRSRRPRPVDRPHWTPHMRQRSPRSSSPMGAIASARPSAS